MESASPASRGSSGRGRSRRPLAKKRPGDIIQPAGVAGWLHIIREGYTGPRRVVTVKQIPPEELAPAERAEAWFEWEERPGPEPASPASRPNDELVVQVSYVEAKTKA